MWGNIALETIHQANFNIGFSNMKSDVLIHLSQWQYWWWFWFSFLWSLYYLLILRVMRSRTMKFRPRLATTYRPHGKWGDLIICFIPISWCANIISNSNLILRMIEWQTESSLFTIRIRGKQWYWIYKFDLKAITDIFTAPKNMGRDKWFISTPGDMQTGDDYLHVLQLRAQNKWVQKYWAKELAKNTKNENFHFTSVEDLLSFNFYKSYSDLEYSVKNNENNFYIAQTENDTADASEIDTLLDTTLVNSESLVDLEQTATPSSEVEIDDLLSLLYEDEIFLSYEAGVFCSTDIFDVSFGDDTVITTVVDQVLDLDFENFEDFEDFDDAIFMYDTYPYKMGGFDVLNELLLSSSNKFVVHQTKNPFLGCINSNVQFDSTFDNLQVVDSILCLNTKTFGTAEVSFVDLNSDELSNLRWSKRALGTNNSLRLIKYPLSTKNELDLTADVVELLRFRFNDDVNSVKHKIVPHSTYLSMKQKRYKRRKIIYPRVKLFKDVDGINTKYIKYTGKPVLMQNEFLAENSLNATKQYNYFKKKKEKVDLMSVVLNKRMLRTKRTLVLPAHVNLTAITNSYDVIHSWFIPGLGLKMDCIPGRSTHHTFFIDNVGFYYGQCAEVCGRFHHHMPIRICALPFEHFVIWWQSFGLPKLLSTQNTKKLNNYFGFRKYVW